MKYLILAVLLGLIAGCSTQRIMRDCQKLDAKFYLCDEG